MTQALIYEHSTPSWYDNDRAKEIMNAYNTGQGSGQPADLFVAQSAVPAATGSYRDFSYIAPDLPELIAENCVACMECVQNCPDSSIWGKVITPEALEEELAKAEDDAARELLKAQLVKTTKFWKTYEKKKDKDASAPGGAYFGIFIDPTKCKGCGECVLACGEHDALKMIKKTKDNLPNYFSIWDFYKDSPLTPDEYVNPKLKVDIMLKDDANQYVGGAGSCMGCGEASVLRQIMAMTYEKVGHKYGMTCATGCNTVYGATYPYNPFRAPWMNSLFENAPTVAMGVRALWDRTGREDHAVWAIGGDGAMLDIGFQALSRMLASGMNIKALVMDTQAYSNTGGQTSTATYIGQEAKMSIHGKAIRGKMEPRKEIAHLAMMHPRVYVAQTIGPMTTHFYKAIERALEFDGPALVNVYTTCQPEHQVADDASYDQALLAVESRAFPVFTYDPDAGETMAERMSLQGNPSVRRDWHHKKTKEGEEIVDFISFAKTEGRFLKHFDKEGNHSDVLEMSKDERLQNWRLLQDLAGVKNSDWEAEREAKKAKK
uniref:Putative pyruvate:ferredoxin oxidoreductase beta subunit n=1 Tax=Magnetococcus massalia (strain MO-1) TaxID=451514 RepID=A0A1S7LJ09_MAGMO|nr:Putative pyruvate:ferredoxin oxidoreductase beta subunit [Candidatus Magnetococcus massalia]